MKYINVGILAVFLTIASCNGFLFDVKTDCLVSPWSTWTELPGLDMHIRERGILRHDFKGGSPCPPSDEMRQIKTDNVISQIDSTAHIQATARSISGNFLRRNPAHSLRRSASNNPSGIGHVRDLLIVLDSSSSISSADFANTKQHLVDLLGMLCPDPDPFGPLYNHAALIDFSHSAIEIFDFNKYQSSSSLKRAILLLPKFGSNTCTTQALDVAAQTLSTWKGMRPDSLVEKEVLILTDGQSNCGGDVLKSALKLQSKATVYALLIGRFTTSGMHEVLSYVTTPAPNHLFAIKTHRGFDQLMALLQKQSKLVQCMPFDLPQSG